MLGPTGNPIGPLEGERLLELVAELARRRCEALALYEPLPTQAQFHACLSKERLVYGSNRSGKTLSASVEVARAVTGQDPYGKYPKENGVCVCVGKDWKHVGRVMWPALSRAGAFRMIRDPLTRAWRAWRPWEGADKAREGEAKPAPPLVPPRMIASVAWEDKKAGQPSVVTLKNGWQILWFASLGKPGQGFRAHYVWIDEEIAESDWYNEMYARTLDWRGRLTWSAAPQDATLQLYDLHERAEAERYDENPGVVEFFLPVHDNPHVPAEEVKAWEKQLGNNEDAAAVRIRGEWAIEGYKVFPTFHPSVHCCEPFEVPLHWTRYLAVDPGVQVCAVLFLAVPPPGESDHVFFYEELYIRNASAEKFAQEAARRAAGHRFELFLIDPHSAAQRQLTSGLSLQQHYAEALAGQGLASARTGHNFLWGTTDAKGALESMRSWLAVRPSGTPKAQIFKNCVHLTEEIRKWHYLRKGGVLTDEPAKRNDHLIDCAKYLAAFDPEYKKAPKGKRAARGAVAALEAKRKKRKARESQGESFIQLGPALPAKERQ